MDIVALQETHVCADNMERFKTYFGEFEQKWLPAMRYSNYGRGIGGYFLGYKKDLRKKGIYITFETIDEICVIHVRDRNTSLTLIPIYMRPAVWENIYENIKSILTKNRFVNPIIIGDLNIRIGNLQVHIEDEMKHEFVSGLEERKSKDAVINSRGRKFLDLCYDFGLVIANGMTVGDENGELTFVSGIGESVNDICAVSHELLKFILSFHVDEKTWSDHFPIVLTLQINSIRMVENNPNLLPKLKWDPNNISKYHNNITSLLQTKKQTMRSFTFGDITNIIKEAHSKIYINVHIFTPKQKWFNLSCHKARKQAQVALQKYRIWTCEENRLQYCNKRRKYKQLCLKAKDSYYKRIERNLEKVQNSKDWWRMVREIRNISSYQEIKVSAEDLRRHFQGLLSSHQEPDIFYAYRIQFDRDLDKPITLAEIKNVLSKTKDHKAAGVDRVPYEFFKNAPNELLEEMMNTFNVGYDSGCIDESLLRSIIFPIFKKGDRTLPCNYRGIAFMDCIAKIMMGILNGKLTS
ncbi:uncharacterized protein LOC142224734 [Haematobia irritans]|uniref:uncharacterized protein LOC142224734 n=1 Tax=Haematobia irritans TaxID=7368 RepID=UPI003F4F81FC